MERARKAGYDSWEEYKNAGWKYKSSDGGKVQITPEKQESANISKIGMKQLQFISKLVNINEAMYKTLVKISNNGGVGSSGGPIMVSNPSSNSQSGNMAEFGNNRNGYASSHYAFA